MSQIQALDRTQPGLPMKPGRAGTMTHDYKRHGTTTLFAALNVLDGTVIGRNMQRHRHQEFIRFLNAIEAQVPVQKSIHAIVDNYATHKHPKVRQWLARHPRWNARCLCREILLADAAKRFLYDVPSLLDPAFGPYRPQFGRTNPMRPRGQSLKMKRS